MKDLDLEVRPCGAVKVRGVPLGDEQLKAKQGFDSVSTLLVHLRDLETCDQES